MDFGIFLLMQHRDQKKSSQRIIRETIEQVQAADRLGFGAAWFAEHHFNNYCLCPSPLMMVAHCAGVTERIRLGSAVVVVPLYNHARLTEEIAMADQLSGGRLNVGIGGGYQQYEFERFGADLQNAKEMTIETLDIIERGLTHKKFSYDGKHLKQPTTAISVRPVQTPIPPIWVASADPNLMRKAIARDHNVFISGWLGGPKLLTGFRQTIDELALQEGKRPEQVKVGLTRFAFASDNKDEVMHYLDCARYQQRLAVSLKTRVECMEDDYMVQEQPFDKEIPLEKMLENLPVGSVDMVVERMVRELRIVKPVHVALQTQVGDMGHQTMLQQLELWSKVIIPGIQQELKRDPGPLAAPAAEKVAA
jgi:alkanesulfonate monooxygenase SsuD/methylene tetrahydromethanopterin reductase-like flavin-dependent oxidoreductase (luciferase family)